ncbi:MAG: radical SAM protein [Candidatus Omnitrophica bacterium]|nr:radical SAM protein [Candidatus Omnitrophota bacterium]
MDEFNIDGHKLMYHPDRVHDWLQGKTVYPLYVEISPAGACNHRCTFCAVDYIGYKTRYLDKDILKNCLTNMAEHGVKSVMYAGEGEPLLFKGLAEVIVHTKKVGIDVAITTNAVALTDKFMNEALSSISWIKASVNAGAAETYAKIHQTNAVDFERALGNLERAVQLKRKNNYQTALGIQCLLLPENAHEMPGLARRAKSMGLNYLVVKPYSQHLMSETHLYEGINYQQFQFLDEQLAAINGDGFNVIFRRKTMAKLEEPGHYYTVCQATPHFWAYIMASGDVYGCSAYLEDDRFCYGNINQSSFSEIWEGEKRKKSIDYVQHELNISECRKNCRMDEVNRYLWDIKHPKPHANFI